MTDLKRIMASTEFVSDGIKTDFVVTGFKKNGDTAGIWRPANFSAVSLDPKDSKKILYIDASELMLWQVFETPENAQAVLNAIGERKERTFYYNEEATEC